MGLREQWEVSLLKALSNPMQTFVPPSIVMADNPLSSMLMDPNLYPVGDSNFFIAGIPTNVIVGSSGRQTSTFLGVNKVKRLNYTPISGNAQAQMSVFGGTVIWVWADPLDVLYPIKTSLGPASNSVPLGSSYGPWTCGLNAPLDNVIGNPWTPTYASTYANFSWSNNPYVSPNNWNAGHRGQVPADGRFYDLYPPSAAQPFIGVPITESCSNLYFVNNSRLRVETSDITAFNGASFRTRSVETNFNRYLDRIDNPGTGQYGNCTNFHRANAAVALWSSTEWEPCRIGAADTGEGSNPVPYPSVGSSISGFQAAALYQWASLNRAIANGYPIIEVQVSGTSTTSTVDLALTLEVKLSSAQLYLGGSNCGLTNITAPFPLPPWFCVSHSHGEIVNLEGADVPGFYGSPIYTARPMAAIASHPGDTSTFAKMQNAINNVKKIPSLAPNKNKTPAEKAIMAGQAAGGLVGAYQLKQLASEGNLMARVERAAVSGARAAGAILARAAPAIEGAALEAIEMAPVLV